MSPDKNRYFLCVDNHGNEVSLGVRRVYRGLPDSEAESHGMVRIIDDSGQDYLFPAALFVPIEVPAAAEGAFVHDAKLTERI